jgi:hypothetical protein
MRKITFCACIAVLLFACEKKHDPLFGSVSVSGTVTDLVSNQPIANAVVELVTVRWSYNGLGYGRNRTNTIAATDTTDATGNYSFAINATNEYEFDLVATPLGSLNVSSDFTVGQDETIKTVGNHIKNLQCHRSACAKVSLTNAAPIDTPYSLSLSAYGAVTLHYHVKDTVIYLPLVGRAAYPNEIRFSKSGNNGSNSIRVTAGPWDTIPVHFNF